MRDDEQIDPNDPTTDEGVDVQGQQAPVDWREQPLSDERLSGEARAKLEATGALLP